MKNKNKLTTVIEDKGYKMGCYNDGIEKISKKELDKVIENFFDDSTDIEVQIRGKKHIVEIHKVDNEIDFLLLSAEEFKNQYGYEFGEDD